MSSPEGSPDGGAHRLSGGVQGPDGGERGLSGGVQRRDGGAQGPDGGERGLSGGGPGPAGTGLAVTPEPEAGRDLDLVVVGDCNPDVLVLGGDVTPAFGQQEKLVQGISLVVGGSASITAVAAARLGLRVALAAAVGADPAGRFMLDQLTREGVDTSAVAVRDALPTGMTVALSSGGDRAILTALGAVGSLTPDDVPAALLARARHVHVSSYFLLEDSLGAGLANLMATAKAAGAKVSLDTNWDPSGRWGDGRLTAALAQADLLLPNEAEALRLSGQPDLAGAAEVLGQDGTALVVKLGERGALIAGPRSRYRSQPGPRSRYRSQPGPGVGSRVEPEAGFRAGSRVEPGAGARVGPRVGLRRVSLPPVTPVDTTGAGDCFNAGVIAGLVRGLDLPEAVALGCATGALSTRAPGGTSGCPDLETAKALARQAKDETAGAASPMP